MFGGSNPTRPGATASSSQTSQRVGVPIDPSLIPLPESEDDDLSDARSVARAHGYTSTDKAAGSRHKGKQRAEPKHKHRVDDPDDDSKTGKRGRPHGAGNYTQTDLSALLDYVQAELPLGQRGWKVIHGRFIGWARKHKRPERAQKSLETKFKQVCVFDIYCHDAYSNMWL